MKRKCHHCNGTGVIGAGGGMSDATLVRGELVRVWCIVGFLMGFFTVHVEFRGAITELVDDLDGVRSQLHSRNEGISNASAPGR